MRAHLSNGERESHDLHRIELRKQFEDEVRRAAAQILALFASSPRPVLQTGGVTKP